MLPLWPFPLPVPVPEEAEPCLESSDQATRCTNTAADCAPLYHTDANHPTKHNTEGHTFRHKIDTLCSIPSITAQAKVACAVT